MTTKVTNTESHKTSQKDSVTCAKGKLVLIEWDKKLIKTPVGSGENPKMPIIISETEKLPKLTQCKVYNSISKKIEDYYSTVELKVEKIYFILALPENFSPKQLKAVADGKIKDGEKVLIKCEVNAYDGMKRKIQYAMHEGDYTESVIMLNDQSHITLHVAENTWDDIIENHRVFMVQKTGRDISIIQWLKDNYNPPTLKS